MSRIREGTVIAGKYRIERPLARGGMGSIWVARHRQLDMPVAVKFLDPSFAATSDGRTRFEREAKAVALAQSPHIIHIHDYGIHEDLPYMAMELLRGEDLGARIRREGRLPLPVVADVVGQVCKALRKAHEAGILHRDLKPANVFLSRDDDEQIVKVLDFGIAKFTGMGEAVEATRTGVVVGTVHYMSPEQARGMKDIDHRSDLWSLGVIAFRALTGHLPFPGDQMGDVIVKICSDPLPLLTSYRPDLGPEVDAFFARALARRPDERFQNAREMAQAFLALPGATAALPAAAMPVSQPGLGHEAWAAPVARTFAEPRAAAMPVMSVEATPPVAPVYPPPPMAGTITTASQSSDVSGHAPARGASKRTVVLVGLACAVVLAIGGALALRGGGNADAPAAAAPASSSAPAPVVTVATATTTTPAATASAEPAPAHDDGAVQKPDARDAGAPEQRPASAATSTTAKAKAPPARPRINSELGF